MQYLFEHATVLQPQGILEHAFVATKNECISYVGTTPPEGEFTPIDARGKLLMSGLINAHTHIPMTLLRSYGGGCDLQTWLFQYIFPVEDKLDAKAVRIGSELALAELIRAGVTCIADMYMFCDTIAEAVVKAGISGNIARGLTLFSEDFSPETHQGFCDMKALHESWHGANGGQILVDASIHGEYTSNHKLWQAVSDYAQRYDLGMHVHLSETQSEHEACLVRHGKTPTQILNAFGVWNSRALAAHAVWTTPEDWAILQEKDVCAVHNPVSNLKLGSGIAPIASMRQAGVRLALGTDGVASNNNHDMFEEMKLAALLQSGTAHNPAATDALSVLNMATCDAAKALGRHTGVIAEGYTADIILLDLAQPHLFPQHNLPDTLLYASRGSDVCFTMARGKILYQNGVFHTLDLAQIRHEAETYALPLLFGKSAH